MPRLLDGQVFLLGIQLWIGNASLGRQSSQALPCQALSQHPVPGVARRGT